MARRGTRGRTSDLANCCKYIDYNYSRPVLNSIRAMSTDAAAIGLQLGL